MQSPNITWGGARAQRGASVREAQDQRTLVLRCAIENLLNAPPVSLQIRFEKDKVVLRGAVSSVIERRTIEEAARDVRGVSKVESHLSVRGRASA
jgi:hypothetical protein